MIGAMNIDLDFMLVVPMLIVPFLVSIYYVGFSWYNHIVHNSLAWQYFLSLMSFTLSHDSQ